MKRISEKTSRVSGGPLRGAPTRGDIDYTRVTPRPWGGLWILVSSLGVCGVSFGNAVLGELPGKIVRRLGPAPRKADRRLAPIARKFKRYLSGQSREIALSADLRGLTPFQQRVLQAVRRIPYGETRSYQWVAHRIGQPAASRAVGAACGANPVPLLIPCHRVIAKDGSLGGFSAGLPHKRRLLDLEQAHL